MLTYFKLTQGKDLSGNEAHQALIELRDELKAKLETDLSAKKDNLQAERNSNAESAIINADSKPAANSQTSNSDPLAELEMWNKVKTSTNASDYYLFLKRFPAGGFAKQAEKRMNEIGDPVWNEVKKSKDPFAFRDYLAKNPNSPFAAEAKEKMNMLAASVMAWEQIKGSRKSEDYTSYLKTYPIGVNSAEARELLEQISWQKEYSRYEVVLVYREVSHPRYSLVLEMQRRLTKMGFRVALSQGKEKDNNNTLQYDSGYTNSGTITKLVNNLKDIVQITPQSDEFDWDRYRLIIWIQ